MMFKKRLGRSVVRLSCLRNPVRLSLESLEQRAMMSADAVLHWNEVAVDAAFAPGSPSPVPFFRNLAMVYVAMYDAVNSIDRSYEPYFAKVPASRAHRWRPQPLKQRTIPFRHSIRTSKRHLMRRSPRTWWAFRRGKPAKASRLAKEVARQILEWRSTDGADMPSTYSLPDDPGNWQPTGAPAAFVHAGTITPFAVDSTSQFRPDPPPSLASAEYATGFNEAKELGGATSASRTTAQTNAAMAWRTPWPLRKRGLLTSPRRWRRPAATRWWKTRVCLPCWECPITTHCRPRLRASTNTVCGGRLRRSNEPTRTEIRTRRRTQAGRHSIRRLRLIPRMRAMPQVLAPRSRRS